MLYTLTQDFARMVRERTAVRLDDWLATAASSRFPEVRSFVTGVRRDYAAVRAGLTLPRSQGQVEGQVTRLKFLKRQMYGPQSSIYCDSACYLPLDGSHGARFTNFGQEPKTRHLSCKITGRGACSVTPRGCLSSGAE